jgi:hypothetical protein
MYLWIIGPNLREPEEVPAEVGKIVDGCEEAPLGRGVDWRRKLGGLNSEG